MRVDELVLLSPLIRSFACPLVCRKELQNLCLWVPSLPQVVIWGSILFSCKLTARFDSILGPNFAFIQTSRVESSRKNERKWKQDEKISVLWNIKPSRAALPVRVQVPVPAKKVSNYTHCFRLKNNFSLSLSHLIAKVNFNRPTNWLTGWRLVWFNIPNYTCSTTIQNNIRTEQELHCLAFLETITTKDGISFLSIPFPSLAVEWTRSFIKKQLRRVVVVVVVLQDNKTRWRSLARSLAHNTSYRRACFLALLSPLALKKKEKSQTRRKKKKILKPGCPAS